MSLFKIWGQVLFIAVFLSIPFISCQKGKDEPAKASKMERYEQISDAELNQTDSQGKTLLHLAAKERDTALLEYLLNKGLDVHAKTADLDTPLHLAVFNNDIPSAEVLFFNGAFSDVLAENKDKVSPFTHAVRNRYYAMAGLRILFGHRERECIRPRKISRGLPAVSSIILI